MYKTIEEVPAELLGFLLEEGYEDLKVISGKLCGLYRFIFTKAIIVGLSKHGYEYRYCYDDLTLLTGAYGSFESLDVEPEDYIVKK